MDFLKKLFSTAFGASNAKAIVTAVIGFAASIVAHFGYHLSAEDVNAILSATLFLVGLFVHDGSIGNWRSTLAGVVGAVLYGMGRFGLHIPPELQTWVVSLTGMVIGWFSKPLPAQE